MSKKLAVRRLETMRWVTKASFPAALLAFLLLPTPAFATDHSYPPDDGELMNPERGWYESIDLVNETELD